MRFRETRLERDEQSARLLTTEGRVLLELRGDEIDEAIRSGFIDPANWHFSMYEYVQIRRDVQTVMATSTPETPDFDREFLARYNIRWD